MEVPPDPPSSGHPRNGTPGSEVKDDGGGERAWVPSIPLGWDGAGFRLRGGNPMPKIGGLILMMIVIELI